jgi:outer membrane receptor for ferric coprogen and ferric-rhodotorulic acid
MYIKINNQTIEKYPYSIRELCNDNPQTSFPEIMTNNLLAEWNVYPVKPVDIPSYDAITENLTEGTPVNVNGQWTQNWIVSDATSEEIIQRQQAQELKKEQMRLNDYRNESDPLFFRYQRGEVEKQGWLDKVSEIKTRYSSISFE